MTSQAGSACTAGDPWWQREGRLVAPPALVAALAGSGALLRVHLLRLRLDLDVVLVELRQGAVVLGEVSADHVAILRERAKP